MRIALPAAGALLSWLFLHRLLDEREHGIGEVIWAAAREGGRMPRHGIYAQLVGSWLTVGFGGSAGPEGPIAYSGAAIGSNTASALNLTERRRVSLLGCGVAGAISSIFNAPVTGLLFALEVVLGEWASFHVLPIAISSVVANVIASTALAGEPVLGVPEAGAVAYLDYVWLIGLAVLAGLGAVLLLRAIHAGAWCFRRLSRPAPWQPLAGGLLVGLIGLLAPQIIGEGYAGIRATFSGGLADFSIWALFGIAGLKCLATALSLGSGGCGGIFAPSLFVGAFVGFAYHELLVGFGLLEASTPHAASYALLGMAGSVGGTLQAPLTAIFLVAEVTGSYALLLPLILVTALSALVAQWLERSGVYQQELAEEHGSVASVGVDSRILAELSIDELLVEPDLLLFEDQHLEEVEAELQASEHDLFAVCSRDGKYVGILRSHFLLGHAPEVRRFLLLSDVMDASWPSVLRDAEVSEVLAHFSEVPVVPVVDDTGRPIGFVSSRALLQRYRQELLVMTSR